VSADCSIGPRAASPGRYPAPVAEDDRGTGIDSTVPHSARIWNYWLGGKDNYPVDRAAGDAWVAVDPDILVVARESRAFLRRAVRYLAGLPTAENTHEVAQRVDPGARIVYVDNDPLILAHARALMTSTPGGATHYMHADMNDPTRILEGAGEVLDLGQPVAIIFMGVLGHVARTEDARALVRTLVDATVPGSHLLIGDSLEAGTESGTAADAAAREAQGNYRDTGAVPYNRRTEAEVRSFFDGLEWVEPGFVPVPLWRPDRPEGLAAIGRSAPPPLRTHGGVARKPPTG
jgi:SAM-dependent methyltransferase